MDTVQQPHEQFFFENNDLNEVSELISNQTWTQENFQLAQAGDTKPKAESDKKDLYITPLNWGEIQKGKEELKEGTGSEPDEKASEPVVKSEPKEESTEKKPEGKRVLDSLRGSFLKPEKPEENQELTEREKIKQSLRNAFINNKDNPEKQEKAVKDFLATSDLPKLEEIAQEELNDINENVDEIAKYEDPNFYQRNEKWITAALVAFAGYRVVKEGGRLVLAKVKGAMGRAGSESGEKPVEEKRGEAREAEANKETRSNASEETRTRPNRRRAPEVTEFGDRVTEQSKGDGTYEKTVSRGSEAILGPDRAEKSLTKSEVALLKQEIARLKASKNEAEMKKGRNLERVAKMLENSENPRLQEKAHEYIRNKIKEAPAKANWGRRAANGIALAIIVYAALEYYRSNLNDTPDLEENERAGVSDK